jgi:hypothetical protein
LGQDPAHSLVSDHGKILWFSPTGPQSNKSSTEIRHFGEKIRQIADIERKVGSKESPRAGEAARSWIGLTKSGGRDNAPEGVPGVHAMRQQEKAARD